MKISERVCFILMNGKAVVKINVMFYDYFAESHGSGDAEVTLSVGWLLGSTALIPE